ncbi:MAG: DUF1501 domain-containing protein [Sphingobacteriales bacterium]|jgi:uncharacterized protein (DUF1501 family)|nr:DUF1501 domain-containing protein [Sphingobacteriales bacterium]MBP9142074.1 DUF1501 domain-containing protein [Chitinophagales bacterium]MDA0198752.1 DUF1501 domain-containing protein [Bacteroidota bacterium]MBK6889573.1 DUF1501 domain-containing protein [Sphingobacteriales bacterium]MBK7527922.1 DUF1501 domain-containing protein [Sphingobacteriales bacterium]
MTELDTKNQHQNCDHQIREGATLNNSQAHQNDHTNWSRRSFLTSLGLTAVGGMLMAGSNPLRVLAGSPILNALAASPANRTLVIIRLDGGNDGLNTIIPRGNSYYYNARPNIAITEANLSPLTTDVGINKAMDALLPLWNEGKMAVMQSVGYPSQNYSHFRSSDIWATASDSDTEWHTGWLGRTLANEFPLMSEAPPTVPPAIEIGLNSSLSFAHDTSGYMSLAVYDMVSFYRLAQTGQLWDTSNLADCEYGDEQKFMRQMYNNSYRYADNIKKTYEKTVNTANYPNSTLARQMAAVARLIKGRLGTKVYMVSIGGFDTHVNQVGAHETLLSRIAESVKAFFDDLNADQEVADNTLVMTISEFGRRLPQNGTAGTDHSSAAPVLMWGNGVIGGVKGNLADLNIPYYAEPTFTLDFRTIYAAVLKNWFCLNPVLVDYVFQQHFDPTPNLLPDCSNNYTDNPAVLMGHNPNATYSAMEIKFGLMYKGQVTISILNPQGQKLATILSELKEAGSYTVTFNRMPYGLPPGDYLYRIEAGGKAYTRKIGYLF